VKDPGRKKDWVGVLMTAVVIIIASVGLLAIAFFVFMSFALANWGSSK